MSCVWKWSVSVIWLTVKVHMINKEKKRKIVCCCDSLTHEWFGHSPSSWVFVCQHTAFPKHKISKRVFKCKEWTNQTFDLYSPAWNELSSWKRGMILFSPGHNWGSTHSKWPFSFSTHFTMYLSYLAIKGRKVSLWYFTTLLHLALFVHVWVSISVHSLSR